MARSGGVPYWRLSSFYFFHFAVLGSLLPYWPVYLLDSGFDPGQVGVLMGIMAATKLIAPNVWGWIADRAGNGLGVIRFGSLCTVFAFAAMAWRVEYWPMALGTFAFSFFWNAALPSFEAITLRHLHGQQERYSRVRLWGSIGFITCVLAVGKALDVYSSACLPYLVAVLLTGIWLMSLLVPSGAAAVQRQEDASFWRLLWRGEVLAFLVVAFLVQLAHGPYYVFFTVYLKSHGYSGAQAGQLWSLGVVAEVALFLVMARLLRRVSLRRLLLASLLLGALRWWATAYAVDIPWALAASQTLHAATFGITHVVAIHLIHRHFGGAHHSKGQALYNSVSYGLGGMLGSWLSGLGWASLGPEAVFNSAALASALGLLIAYLWVGRAEGKSAGA